MLVSKRPTQSLVVGGVYIGRVVNIIIRDWDYQRELLTICLMEKLSIIIESMNTHRCSEWTTRIV